MSSIKGGGLGGLVSLCCVFGALSFKNFVRSCWVVMFLADADWLGARSVMNWVNLCTEGCTLRDEVNEVSFSLH